MISVLCCPQCKGAELSLRVVQQEGERLTNGAIHCNTCDAEYEIREGIPDFAPRELLSSAQWRLWCDHLAGLEARRQHRQQNPGSLAKITNRSSRLMKAFADFARIRRGTVLDVGCGPGNFRRQLDPRAVRYFGIDPLPLETTDEFYFARALAEFIPFQDGVFSDVIVMSALDHFQDLDAFFSEVARVLQPGGKLHIVQSIHDVRGPLSAVKAVTHWFKDYLEDAATRSKSAAAPKHMTEFSKSAVYQAVSRRFDVVAEGTYSKRWYSPSNLFLTMSVRSAPVHQEAVAGALIC